MTPFEISIMLHYATGSGDFRNGDFSAPIVVTTLEMMASKGLLRRHEGESSTYSATDGARMFVAALCRVPTPVQQWVVPAQPEPPQ